MCSECKALKKKLKSRKNSIVKEITDKDTGRIIKKICCSKCGAIDKKCKHPEICNLFVTQSFNGLITYLKFDPNCFGTEKFYDEFFRVQNELDDLYNNKEYSVKMISEYYGHQDCSNFTKILKKFINVSIDF